MFDHVPILLSFDLASSPGQGFVSVCWGGSPGSLWGTLSQQRQQQCRCCWKSQEEFKIRLPGCGAETQCQREQLVQVAARDMSWLAVRLAATLF
jgi:hypothetical protein